MSKKKGNDPVKKAERELKQQLRQAEQKNKQATSGSSKPTNTPAPAPQYNIQASPGNPTPTADRPGRYDMAGKYMGASSPVQLPGGGGMSAKMAATVQEKRSEYPTHANPAGGTPKYTYNY